MQLTAAAAPLLMMAGGLFFFVLLPFSVFRIQHILGGRSILVFTFAVGLWFVSLFLFTLGSLFNVPDLQSELFITISAAAMGIAVMEVYWKYLQSA
ncbi:MAG: hypothetical protein HY558_05520 [Euryarchaeota archaeon]|nr:hypothetical protein [Euryarchaeota archaeon]